jgi:hypothetical protein
MERIWLTSDRSKRSPELLWFIADAGLLRG